MTTDNRRNIVTGICFIVGIGGGVVLQHILTLMYTPVVYIAWSWFATPILAIGSVIILRNLVRGYARSAAASSMLLGLQLTLLVLELVSWHFSK